MAAPFSSVLYLEPPIESNIPPKRKRGSETRTGMGMGSTMTLMGSGSYRAVADLPSPKKSKSAGSLGFSQGRAKNITGVGVGSSTATEPGSSSGPVTKKRKKSEDGRPAIEKRQARLRSKCPQNILERLERARSQTFYLLERRRIAEELREEFDITGSTGNVYTVVIDHLPRCSCPDSGKGNHCKHILFVFMKVLQIPTHTSLWYQKALVSSELQEIFSIARIAPNSVANPRVQAAYARVTGKSSSPNEPKLSQKKRIPGEGDDCPICYDTMYKAAEAILVFCDGCGNAVHKICFSKWRDTSIKNETTVTCVWCRSPWVSSAGIGSTGDATTSGGYINLAREAGLSPARDTSSYYHGPRRGQRFWESRQYYDED
ncbi:hypothetical protein FA15DRAFT_674946 [Coprinopsis marcescibilis]|uniref:SWIM-type domain-containing protein n=1 Tax=Coprinopsis marcescibilis TaxID=230819 RepID=A0A5C3KFU5_COPMA|nr:hypothetical protein FA15DRAFT_674946 [Coprinopsis marcescibilis]